MVNKDETRLSPQADDRRALTVGARVNEDEFARIDAASRLRRRSRSDYLREVALSAAAHDLGAAARSPSESR